MKKLLVTIILSLILFSCNADAPVLRSSEPNLDQVGAPTIAYVTDDDGIGMMYDDGTLAYTLPIASDISVSGLGANQIDFSPDGLSITFRGFINSTSNLYIINTSGTGMRMLVAGGIMSPMWSNDGSRIAYLQYSSADGGYYLYTIDPATGIQQQITDTNPFYSGSIAWSQDDSQIAVLTSVSFDEGDEIIIVDAATGNRSQITNLNSKIYSYLRWSPISQQFLTSEHGFYLDYRVHRIEANGSGLTNLTGPASDGCRQGSWTPDNKILYVKAEDFMIMNADGSNKTLLHDWEDMGNWQPIARTAPQGPDLVIVDAGTRNVNNGQTIEIFFKIRNIGNAASTDTDVYINAINPNVPDFANEIRDQKSVLINALAQGEETTELQTNISSIDYQRKGIEYFEIIADPKNSVVETNERNNELQL